MLFVLSCSWKEKVVSNISKIKQYFYHVTAGSIVVSSNVSGNVKRFYQCKPVKAVCSSNVGKQNACNVISVGKSVSLLNH